MYQDLQAHHVEGEDLESQEAVEQYFNAEINWLLLTYSVNELCTAAVR
jgi:hypothetical protein